MSGFSLARRATNRSSVPTAQLDPGGEDDVVLMIYEVEPTSSASSTTSGRHSGWTTTRTPGCSPLTRRTSSGRNRTCTLHVPCHKISRARANASIRSGGRRGSQTAISPSGIPSLRAAFRPRYWSGTKRTFSRWEKAHRSTASALEEVQHAPPFSPTKALTSAVVLT